MPAGSSTSPRRRRRCAARPVRARLRARKPRSSAASARSPASTPVSFWATTRREEARVIVEERATGASGKSPIAGLKLLDFTHVFAGPFCTRTLADLGADVVHVESAVRDPGDRHRATYAHRNKRSIALDLKSEAGHSVATRLAMGADVVVENFS